MLSQIRPALVSTAVFTLLLGVVYPLLITGVAQVAFPYQAGGSIVVDKGKPVGSALIGQTFAAPQYLHPRPSAAGMGYDASASGGSNYGPLNTDLAKRVKDGADQVRKETGQGVVPADSVTTSASGLDPDISPAYARLQAARIATTRKVPVAEIQKVVDAHTQGPWLGIFGQPHVNVLMTNRDLDKTFAARAP